MLKIGDKVGFLSQPLIAIGTVINTRAGITRPDIQVVRIEFLAGGTLWYEAGGLVKVDSTKLKCECNLCLV